VAYGIKLWIESSTESRVDEEIEDLKRCVFDTPWLVNPEDAWESFESYMNFSMEELNLLMGNQKYDQEDYKSAYEFYHRVIKQMSQSIPEMYENYIKKDSQLATLSQLLTSEKKQIYSKALSNMGIIHLMIDDAQEGINKLEIAYQVYPNNRILISLLRSKVEFLKMEPKSVVSSFLPQLLEDRDETILGFLVWFFHECGEEEESITSYLQLHSKPYELLYIKEYMLYMVKSNQIVAMKYTLDEIIQDHPIYFYYYFIQTLIELDHRELAFELFQQIDVMPWFQDLQSYDDTNQSIGIRVCKS
jgi:tetratricopeptide (TPR) repeat protein